MDLEETDRRLRDLYEQYSAPVDTVAFSAELYERLSTLPAHKRWMPELRWPFGTRAEVGPGRQTAVLVPKISAPKRRSGLRVTVYASMALVLVAAVIFGGLEAVQHLGKDQQIVVVGDDSAGISPGSTGGTTQTTMAAGVASRPITALAADPGDPLVLYAGSRWNLASLWVSTDAGASWELLKDFGTEGLVGGLGDPSIAQLVIDPDQPSIVYAGLNGLDGGYLLMKSIDRGATWTRLEHGGQLWIDPSSSSTLYVLSDGETDQGLWRSTDGGATWAALVLPDPGSGFLWSFVIDPRDPSVLYAKIGGHPASPDGLLQSGLVRSRDGGVTWQDITNRLPGLIETPGWGPLSLAIDPLDDSTVCALPSENNLGYVFPPFDESTSIGLTQRANFGYVSTDQGAAWSRLSDAALLELKARLKAAPGTSVAAVGAAAGFLESYTRGLSVEFEPTLTESATSIAATVATHFVIDADDPQRIYVGTDHGVFLSTDGGASWTMSNTGLPAAESDTVEADSTTTPQNGSVPTSGSVGDSSRGVDDSASTFNWLQNYPRLLDPAHDVVIMEIESPSPSYWRAGALDTFTGRAWTGTQAFLVPLEQTQSGDTYTYSVPEVSPTPSGLTVTQTFRVRSVYANYLFVGGDPRSIEIDQAVALRTNDMRAIHSNQSLGPELTYSVTAVIPDLEPADLVGKGSNYPEALGRYLGLPFPRLSQIDGPDREATWRSAALDSTPDGWEWVNLCALNQEIVGDATDPYDVTLRIEDYLRKAFEYSLAPRPTDYSSPYSAFLFDTRSGYCQHFAGSMALLLRYNGIPSRVAVGFASGNEKESGVYTVSTNNVHAWVEVYFPDVGWIAFDPTTGRNLPTGPSSSSPGFVGPFGR